MIGHAQASDRDELARLYRRNHPGLAGSFEPEAKHESQTFVAKDDAGRIIGLALVSRIAYGVHSHAIIHELEVASGVDLNTIGPSLIKACLGWLTERGTPRVHVSSKDRRAYMFYRSVGFEECDWNGLYKLVPIQMARQIFV